MTWKVVARRGVVFLAILAGFMLATGTSATAGTYLGELCGSITFTDHAPGTVTPVTIPLRMGVSYEGGTYYTLQGIATSPDGTSTFSGTAILSGSQVLLTLTRTGSEADTGIVHMTLDVSTLNGTFWEVGHDFYPPSRTFSTYYNAGTGTLNSCP